MNQNQRRLRNSDARAQNILFLICKYKDFIFYPLESQLQDSSGKPHNDFQIKDSGNDHIQKMKKKIMKKGKKRNLGKIQPGKEEGFIFSFITELFGGDQARLFIVLLNVEYISTQE